MRTGRQRSHLHRSSRAFPVSANTDFLCEKRPGLLEPFLLALDQSDLNVTTSASFSFSSQAGLFLYLSRCRFVRPAVLPSSPTVSKLGMTHAYQQAFMKLFSECEMLSRRGKREQTDHQNSHILSVVSPKLFSPSRCTVRRVTCVVSSVLLVCRAACHPLLLVCSLRLSRSRHVVCPGECSKRASDLSIIGAQTTGRIGGSFACQNGSG